MNAGADDWWLGRGLDPSRTLLENQISYAELVDANALRYVNENQLRRWFDGQPTITVGQGLDIKTTLPRKFWAIMRDEVLPDQTLHQLAVDYAEEFLIREEPPYVDYRTRHALDAKQEWLDGKISIGDLRVAAIGATQALVTIAGLDDKRLSACAYMVCQALTESAEDAQRQAFYTFLAHFGYREARDWLLEHVRTRLGDTPSGWSQDVGPAPGQVEAAGQAMAIDQNLPVGTVLAFAGWHPKDLVAKGWLVCDGTTRLGKDYEELFAAIGYTFGCKSTSDREFNLPDLRGRFIRSTASDTEKRDRRDPEWRDRKELMPGGANKEKVGSYQDYGTAKPRTAFSTSITNLDIVKRNDADGCGNTPAEYNSGSATYPVRGGDAETRPDNKYVYFVIKAFSASGGQPVQAPVGAVISFAGPYDPNHPPAGPWDRCRGQSEYRIGKYDLLYEEIGWAHGSEGGNYFNLPGYGGTFLRGVSEFSGTDPDRDRRGEAKPGGYVGNNVGSKQDWATAIPYDRRGGEASQKLLRTTFNYLPTANRRKIVDFVGKNLARVNPSGKNLTLSLGSSGDAETRPVNLSVDYYIKFQPEGDVPVGTIITVGCNLPGNDFWLPCNGQPLDIASYTALHQAIGTTYGSPGAGQFNLPDTEARFLRGGTDAVPVGTVQEYATGRPRTEFAVSVPYLPESLFTTGGGVPSGAAGVDGAKTIDPWSSGGNDDTRPVNLYLNCYIRVR